MLSEVGAAWGLQKIIVPLLHDCDPKQLPDQLAKLHCITFDDFPELIRRRIKHRAMWSAGVDPEKS